MEYMKSGVVYLHENYEWALSHAGDFIHSLHCILYIHLYFTVNGSSIVQSDIGKIRKVKYINEAVSVNIPQQQNFQS